MAIILLNASLASSLVNFRGPLICAMIARGHVVHASAPDMTAEIADTLKQWGAQAHEVPLTSTGLNPFADLGYLRAIRSLIRTTGAERVIGYTIKPNIWGSLAARMAGVPSASIVTGLGYAFIPRAGLVRKAVQKAVQWLYGLATAGNSVVVFQNPDDQADFTAAGSLWDPAKARLVNGSGVDMAHYRRVPLPDMPVFLMISRFLWTKGVAEYCEAAAQLKAEGLSARFLLVGYAGSGPDAIPAEKLTEWEARGVENLGQMDDVRPAIAQASVYVLPSYREGTPRSVLEAMAMGRAIITTDAPGCRETVTHGDNGLLVPPRTVPPLVEAMRALALDGSARSRMGDSSHTLASRKYAIDEVNRSYLAHLGL